METLRNKFTIVITLVYFAFTIISCNTDSDNDGLKEIPTKEAFTKLKKEALENVMQEFQVNASDGWVTLTSEKGVEIDINPTCLTLENGDALSGNIDIKFVELFNKGNMALTNKPTMGLLPNSKKGLLISGGEFLIEATNSGNKVILNNCTISLRVPTALTNGDDNDMTLWNGTIDEEDNLTWEEEEEGAQGKEGLYISDAKYNVVINNFGWSNIDRFYNDPRPKTTIKVKTPIGYDYTNCAIYVSYNGESTGLASLDTYDEVGEYFSEHYGQIPIGLECHLILMTEDNGAWSYAIKPVTIVGNEIITFALGEFINGTATQLETTIDGLP